MSITAHITRYSTDTLDWARLSGGQALAILGSQSTDSLTLEVDDITTQEVVALTSGIYRVLITGGDVRLRISDGESDIDKGEYWRDGAEDMRFIRKGHSLMLKAAS